jgi:hypothetical protein
MVGYRNDQFYRIEAQGEYYTGPKQGGMKANNPPFAFPDNTIRITDGDGNFATQKLLKGYCRSLLTKSQGIDVEVNKCQFQFNPQVLQSSVQMNSGMLNYFQQDASQLAQPLSSESNFTFEMMFDRTQEVNDGRTAWTSGFLAPWEEGDVGQVGVLRDIAAFYAVIGQGISKNQREYAQSVYNRTLEADFAKDTLDAESSGGASSADLEKAKEHLGEFLGDMNLGNTAFLLPLPVRVIFSALFMVEGYVSSTSVVFSKFNSSLVPIQASLSVTMKALHIGFAKKDTYLTYALDKANEDYERAQRAERAEREDSYLAALGELGNLNVSIGQGAQYGGPVTFSTIMESNGQLTTGAVVNNAEPDGPMYQLLKSLPGSSVRFSYTYTVYGPYPNATAFDATTGVPKATGHPGSNSSKPAIFVSHFESNAMNASAWKSAAGNKMFTAPAARPNPPSFLANQYYTIAIKVFASLKVGSQTLTSTGVKRYLVREGEDRYDAVIPSLEVSMNWGNLPNDTVEGLPPIPDAAAASASNTSGVGAT